MKKCFLFLVIFLILIRTYSQVEINIGLSGDFPTLTTALNYLQTISINQPYKLLLNGDYNSALETFPIVLKGQRGANQINTITIKPAPGVTTFIKGSVTGGGVIEVYDGSYYILDGSNELNGSNQNLTLINTSTSFIDYSLPTNYQSNSVIWFRSNYGASGCNNNIIKNCNINGQNFLGNISVLHGILFNHYPWLTDPNDTNSLNKHGSFSNNIITNNHISNVKFSGISIVGNVDTIIDQNNEISNNQIGSEFSFSIGPSFLGILAANQQNISINNNEIQNMNHTTNDLVSAYFGASTMGIGLYNITQSTIASNAIHYINISNNHYGAGLYYNQQALLLKNPTIRTENIFYNQVIHDLNFNGVCLDSFAVSGFDYNNGRNDTIIYNSISLIGAFGNSNKKSAVFKYSNNLPPNSLQFDNIVLCNNIFYLQNANSGSDNYVLAINGNLPPARLTANNFASNALFDSITYLPNNFFAYINQTIYKTPLTFFSIYPNYNSYLGSIEFVNPRTDVHILYQSNLYQNAVGKYFPNIVYDKDGLLRQNTRSIGAYNFQLNPAPVLSSATPALIQTNDTLWVTGSNIKFIIIKSFPDSIIIPNKNFIAINPISTTDTLYGLKIPFYFKNDVYEVRAANYYFNTITNPILIRIYNFSPDSVYVKSWGLNDWLQYNIVESQPNIVHIGFGLNHRLLLDKNGQVFKTGNNNSNQLNFSNIPFISVFGGLNFSVGLTQNLAYVVGDGLPFNPANTSIDNLVNFASGQSHINYPTYDLNYRATGLNNFNQLIGSLQYSNAVRTAAGGFTSYVLKNDGTVDAWGLNNFGQANIPANLNQNISRVVGGNTHASFLKTDGTVFQIGNNSNSQLSNIPSLSNIQYIHNGAYFSNALDQNGNFYTWGKDSYDTILAYPLNPFYNYATYRGIVSQFPTLTDIVALGEGMPLLYNSVIQRLFIQTQALNGFIEPKKYFKWGDNVTINFNPKPGFVLDSIFINGINSPIKINQSNYQFKNTISAKTIFVKFRLSDSLQINQEPSTSKIVLCANTANKLNPISVSVQASKTNRNSILISYQWYKTIVDNNNSGVLVSEGVLNSFDTTLNYYPLSNVVPDSSFYYVVFSNNQGSSITSKTSGAVVVPSNNLSWSINGDSLQKCLALSKVGMVKIGFNNPMNINFMPSIFQINPLDNSVLELSIFQDTINPNLYYSGTFVSNSPSKISFILRIKYPNGCQDSSQIFNLQWYSPIRVDTQNFYNQTLCKGSTPVPLIVRAALDTNFGNFTWYASPTKSYKNGFKVNKINDSIFYPITKPSSIIADSLWYFAVVNDKFISCANDTTPFSGRIFINYPKIIKQSEIKTSFGCEGNFITPLFVSVNNAWKQNVNYQWFAVRDTMFSTKSLIGVDSVLRIQSSTADTFTYFSIVSSKSNSICPNLFDTSFYNGPFIIYSNPYITNILNDTGYCQNNNLSSVNIQTNSSYNFPLTYNWYKNNDKTNYAGTLIYSSALNNFYIPNQVGISYYYVVVSSSFNAACKNTSNIFKTTLLSKPSAQAVKVNYNVDNQMCILETNATYFQFKLPSPIYQIQLYENSTRTYNGSNLYLNRVSLDSLYSNLLSYNNPTNKFYYFIITGMNNCSDTSVFYQLQWYSRIAISAENLGGRIYCKGQLANPLSISFGPSVNTSSLNYRWFGNATPSYNYAAQISNSVNLIPSTIPSPLILDTMYYYLVIQDNNYACAIDTSSVSGPIIIRSYGISKNLVTKSNVACQNSIFDSIKFTTLTDRSINLAYTWYKNQQPIFQNAVNTLVTDSFIIPSSSAVGTLYYYCITTIQNGACAGVRDTTYFSPPITTFPKPVANSFSNIRTCNKLNNAILLASVQYTGSDPLTYSWFTNSSNSVIGQILARVNYTDTINIASLSSTFPYYLKFVVSNQIGCKDSSNFSEIDLLPSPFTSGVSLQINNNDTPLCAPINSPFNFSVKVNNPNHLQLKTLLYVSNQKNYAGQNKLLNYTSTLNNTLFYSSDLFNSSVPLQQYLYFTLIDTQNNCADTSNIFNLQLFKPLNITSIQMSKASYCKNTPSKPLIVSALQNVGDQFQYYWYSTPDSTYTNATLELVDVDSIFYPPTQKLTKDTLYYFCIIKNLLFSCSYSTSKISGKIVVNPPLFNYDISQQNQIGCVSQVFDSFIIHIPKPFQINAQVQWYVNTQPSFNNATLLPNKDTIYIPNSTIYDTFYYFSITTVSACPYYKDTSNISGAIIYYPVPSFAQNLIDTAFCYSYQNAILEPFIYYAGSDSLYYSWYINRFTRDTNGASLLNPAIQSSNQYLVPTTMIDTNYYFLQITNSVGCKARSNIAQVMIHLTPQLEGSYTIINDSNNKLCFGFNDSNVISLKLVQPFTASAFKVSLFYNTQKLISGTSLPIFYQQNNLFYSQKFYQPQNTSYYFYSLLTNNFGCSNYDSFYQVNWYSFINGNFLSDGPLMSCRNNNFTPLIVSSGSTNFSRIKYQWYGLYQPTDIATNLSFLIPNATDSIFTPPSNLLAPYKDSMYYYAIIYDSLQSCQSDTVGPSNLIAIIYPKIDSLSNAGSSLVCVGQNHHTLFTYINPIWTYYINYKWYKSSSPSPTQNDVLVSTNNPFTPLLNNPDSSYYYVIATGSIYPTPTFCTTLPSDTSQPTNIFITYPYPTINANLLDSLVCNRGSKDIGIQAGYSFNDALLYDWYYNISPTYFNATLAQSSVNSNFKIPNISGDYFYFVQISNSIGCSVTSNIAKLTIIQSPLVVVDTLFISPNIIQTSYLKVKASGANIFYWYPSQFAIPNISYPYQEVLLSPDSSLVFSVVGINGAGCTDTARLKLTVFDTLLDIYPTSIITPNNDGINDFWQIINIDFFPKNIIFIYNEVNQLVKTINNFNSNTEWKGLDYYGSPLKNGQYFYIIDLYKNNIYYRTKKGEFLLRNE